MTDALHDSKILGRYFSKQSWKHIGAWREWPRADARKWSLSVQSRNDMRDLLSEVNWLWEKGDTGGSRYILDYATQRRGETISLTYNEKPSTPSSFQPRDCLNHQGGRKIEGETEKIYSGKKKRKKEKKQQYLDEVEVKGLRNSKMNAVPRTVFLFKLSWGWKELAF